MNVSHSWVGRFLQQQSLYLAVAALVVAVFWATGQQLNPPTVILYSLLLGNLTSLALTKVAIVYRGNRFPYNWLLYLLALFIAIPPVYLVTATIVWFLTPPAPPQPLWNQIITG